VAALALPDRDARDVVLIRAIARGDHGALSELYDRYYRVLFTIALRITRDRAEAEDLLHDVFLEVWRSARDYDARRGRVCTWLGVRMRSRAIDRVRSIRITHNAGDGALARMAAPAAPAAWFARAVDGLAPPHRRVVELAYVHGMTAEEIAVEIAIPVGTVKSRVSAALARLRVVLGSTVVT
jgi:RNA polymerase sigma-70 factor (ECF subfamily)